MPVPTADAIHALNLVVAELIPPPVRPELTPNIMVNPIQTHLAGIGGYVGLHREPLVEMHARRLRAQVVVRVKADDVGGLAAAESSIATALLGADSTRLRSQGVYRITRDIAPATTYLGPQAGIPGDSGAARDLTFDIDFEYRRVPEEISGVIDRIPLDLLTHAGERPIRTLYANDFARDPLADFTPLDDNPLSNGPGTWRFDAAMRRIEQTSAASGGSNAFNASKRGTLLVLNASRVPTAPRNWLLHAEFGADSGGIGVVFNFVDIDNFYFLLLSRPTPYRMFGKKIGGALSFLDAGGRDEGGAYDAGEHRLRLVQRGRDIEAAIDGVSVLAAREDAVPQPGMVGFFSRNGPTARFLSLRWLEL